MLRRDLGQFFTPRPAVALCYALLAGALPEAPRIADPACGDGVFLRFAADTALAHPANLHGCDLDASLAPAWHGLPGIRVGNGLIAGVLPDTRYDLVIGNPPFGRHRLADGLGTGQPAELRFLERFLALARPGGLVCILLPMGVFANARQRAVRARLLHESTILSILALPRNLFAGTSAQCALLVLRVQPPPPGHHFRIGELPAPGTPPEAVAWERLDQRDPALVERLDPPYWRPAYRQLQAALEARWPLATLAEIAGPDGILAGDHVRPSRGEQRGMGWPFEYYQTRQFLPAGYDFGALVTCNERAHARLAHTAVQQWDVLVSCAGVGGAGQGRACLITHIPGPSCTGDVLTVRTASLDPRVLFLLLRSRYGRGQLLRLQNGVSTTNLSAAELGQVRVPLLPAATLRTLAQAYMPVVALHHHAVSTRDRTAHAAVAAGLGALVARFEQIIENP